MKKKNKGQLGYNKPMQNSLNTQREFRCFEAKKVKRLVVAENQT